MNVPIKWVRNKHLTLNSPNDLIKFVSNEQKKMNVLMKLVINKPLTLNSPHDPVNVVYNK
jgi:hypothetical protein